MKKLALVFACFALISEIPVSAQTASGLPENAAPEAKNAAPAQVLEMPARKSRKRMLVDFGLFGCGIHVGWMKPKSSISPDVNDKGLGKPIFNVSAGTHALGIGKN
jgi:hypothetical protein